MKNKKCFMHSKCVQGIITVKEKKGIRIIYCHNHKCKNQKGGD